MFKGCTKLNSVTCLATDISATDCTTDWLSGVAATGTFTKAAAMTDWTVDSASGIPAGWTVQNDGEVTTAIPLTLEAVSSAATVSFQNKASGPVTYKVNGGAAVEIASGTTGEITLEAAGDKVEFFGDNAPLVTAEIELPDEKTVVELPDWIGLEVTNDHRYKNNNLAEHPFSEWKE